MPPQMMPMPQGGYQQAAMQQPPVGNFCSTPIGRFGRGPVNYLGAHCWTMTPQGPGHGQVSN